MLHQRTNYSAAAARLSELRHGRVEGRLKRGVSMRTFVAACDLQAGGYSDWQSVIDLV